MSVDVNIGRKDSMAAAAAFNFGSLLKDIPRGAWVAISTDRKKVIAYGADMRKVLEKAKEKGEPNPIIMRVPQAPGALLL
jgi:Family of unknown function (DUF5678)